MRTAQPSSSSITMDLANLPQSLSNFKTPFQYSLRIEEGTEAFQILVEFRPILNGVFFREHAHGQEMRAFAKNGEKWNPAQAIDVAQRMLSTLTVTTEEDDHYVCDLQLKRSSDRKQHVLVIVPMSRAELCECKTKKQ